MKQGRGARARAGNIWHESGRLSGPERAAAGAPRSQLNMQIWPVGATVVTGAGKDRRAAGSFAFAVGQVGQVKGGGRLGGAL